MRDTDFLFLKVSVFSQTLLALSGPLWGCNQQAALRDARLVAPEKVQKSENEIKKQLAERRVRFQALVVPVLRGALPPANGGERLEQIEGAEQDITYLIVMPDHLDLGAKDIIKESDSEMFTGYQFKELMHGSNEKNAQGISVYPGKHPRGHSLLLVRVVIGNNNANEEGRDGRHSYYYEIDHFHQLMQNVEAREPHDDNFLLCKNQDKICYFSCRPGAKRFAYAGSFLDLKAAASRNDGLYKVLRDNGYNMGKLDRVLAVVRKGEAQERQAAEPLEQDLPLLHPVVNPAPLPIQQPQVMRLQEPLPAQPRIQQVPPPVVPIAPVANPAPLPIQQPQVVRLQEAVPAQPRIQQVPLPVVPIAPVPADNLHSQLRERRKNFGKWLLTLGAPVLLAFCHGVLNNFLARKTGYGLKRFTIIQVPWHERFLGTIVYPLHMMLFKALLDLSGPFPRDAHWNEKVYDSIALASVYFMSVGCIEELAEYIPLPGYQGVRMYAAPGSPERFHQYNLACYSGAACAVLVVPAFIAHAGHEMWAGVLSLLYP